MDPINYLAQVPQEDFLKDIQSGLQLGSAYHQQQQAQALQQQYMSDLKQYWGAPTAQGAALLVSKYPQQREAFQQAWEMIDQAQRDADYKAASPFYAALNSGANDVASNLLRSRINALKNTGKDYSTEQSWLNALQSGDPTQANAVKAGMGLFLAKVDPKFAENYGAITNANKTNALLPGEVRKANAEATTAEVTAGNAQTAADLENQTKQQQIKTAEAQRQIAALNTQIAQANSETERGKLILERDKWNTELAKLQQAQGQGAQDSIDSTTQALSTLNQIKSHPAFKAADYGGVWSKIKGTIPGTERHAMDGWIESLKGQLAFGNLMSMKAASPTGASGLGALSEGEMKMLSNLAGNLDPNSADFPKQLKAVENYLNKVQAKTVARGQAPTSGSTTPVIMTHPQFGPVRDADVNRLMQKYPGQTREQIIQFLRETGGK